MTAGPWLLGVGWISRLSGKPGPKTSEDGPRPPGRRGPPSRPDFTNPWSSLGQGPAGQSGTGARGAASCQAVGTHVPSYSHTEAHIFACSLFFFFLSFFLFDFDQLNFLNLPL